MHRPGQEYIWPDIENVIKVKVYRDSPLYTVGACENKK